MNYWIREENDGVSLKLHVIPRSKAEGFNGFHEDSISIRIKAPPLEGKGNKAIINFIAGSFGVKKKDVIIASGDKSRHKIIKIKGISPAQVKDLLNKMIHLI